MPTSRAGLRHLGKGWLDCGTTTRRFAYCTGLTGSSAQSGTGCTDIHLVYIRLPGSELKAKKLEFQGSRVSANFRDAIGRQSSAVHAPCLNHLAVSRMVAETWDPWNSSFFGL